MYGAGEKNRAVRRAAPRLRGRATSIPRVIPGAVGRAPKISNARVIEEPPQVECIKVLLLEDTTTTTIATFLRAVPSSLACSLLLLFVSFSPSLSCSLGVPVGRRFFPSSAIMIPTRSRSVIILMASCTRRPSGARQKEHRGDAPYTAMLVVRSGFRMPRRVLYGKRGFARVNSHGFASRSFIRLALLFLIKS